MNDTKNRIIATAYELFKIKGYDQVSINDICRACKITKTTFYYHLKSKEDIIIGFYDPATESLVNEMAEILSANNYWEQLMKLFETLIHKSEEIGPDLDSQTMIINLKENRGSYDFREDLTKIAVILIEKAQQAGEIRNQSSPEQLYRASAYAYMGYEFTWCVKKGNFNRMKYIRNAMENIYDVAPELRVGYTP
ncbi:MAG: TetR/AcrR family transcriptional regulator [Firmicutes bacterium]|nr:TetR/AcrR family transcriptional regulator [Bacillota bacterium]